ncbi:MAG TPA: plastocyanin/azurin family copper-binding protein [Nitrosopumilaceae archaeon]|nr:plastocyanin/azurin family copper-binding protein [Nitrosopumilaceae archaeon]
MTSVLVVFVLFGTNSAFAEATYTINIPTGAADPKAPYFWQSEKDGGTSGEIHILPGDTVVWSNADTALHTVTSGNPTDGPDGIFDSKVFNRGESWSHKFTDEGTYPYYCTLHEWMTGIVVVESAYSVIHNVGDDAGDGLTTFDVEYDFNRVIADARVDAEQKAITFTLIGKPQNEDNTLTLFLSKDLISNPNVIWADGISVTDYEVISEGGINIVIIPVTETTEQVTILGSSVVPEFGVLTATILATSLIAVIFITARSKIISKI